MTIPAQCKFCHVPIQAVAADDCPELNIKAWIPLLCCDRCGSFQSWFRRTIDSTRYLCRSWSLLPHKQREAGRGDIAEALERITKRIAEVTCKYYRVGFTWDRDFVDQLMEMPDKAEFICRQYEDKIRLG